MLGVSFSSWSHFGCHCRKQIGERSQNPSAQVLVCISTGWLLPDCQCNGCVDGERCIGLKNLKTPLVLIRVAEEAQIRLDLSDWPGPIASEHQESHVEVAKANEHVTRRSSSQATANPEKCCVAILGSCAGTLLPCCTAASGWFAILICVALNFEGAGGCRSPQLGLRNIEDFSPTCQATLSFLPPQHEHRLLSIGESEV